MGFEVSGVNINFSKVQHWKKGIVDKLTSGVSALLKANNVEVISGEASFINQNEIRVINGYDSLLEESLTR
jgi:dihydrolipoamide dehydrogenase